MNSMRVERGRGTIIFTDNPKCHYKQCEKPFKTGDDAYFETFTEQIYCKKCAVEGNAGVNAESYHSGTIKITKQDPDVLLEEESLRRGEHE